MGLSPRERSHETTNRNADRLYGPSLAQHAGSAVHDTAVYCNQLRQVQSGFDALKVFPTNVKGFFLLLRALQLARGPWKISFAFLLARCSIVEGARPRLVSLAQELTHVRAGDQFCRRD